MSLTKYIPDSVIHWWNRLLWKLAVPVVCGEEKVLGCSFCRGEPMLMQVDCGPDGMRRAVRCCSCGMVGPLTMSANAAIKAWNSIHGRKG